MASGEVSAQGDSRKFDGPLDKRVTREAQKRIVQDLLQADLAKRVPGADPDDRCRQVNGLLSDQGNRFEFRFRPDSQPITFDAGECGLWINPGGFACLLCYQHGDPTYGLNVAVYNPDGTYRDGGIGMDGYEAFDLIERAMP